MADELKLKITLDDGSIREGFLSLQKQGAKTAKKVGESFDKNGDFLNKLTGSLEAVSGGFSSVSSSVVGLLGPVGAFTAAIGAAAVGVGKLALEGEKANAVNTQFIAVAQSAGLAADALSESIIRNTQGLIDDEEALQITTKAITALGTEASKLPEILNLSRRVSQQLGSDFKTTFENLSQFLETGNARTLRQYGIILDLDKAYASAAKSVGLTTAELTEQQKQTIRTNLVLEELPKKFQAATQSVTPLADAFTRLKVNAANTFEEIQKSIANFITTKFIDEADKSNVATSRLKSSFTELSTEISTLEKRLDILNNERLGARGASKLIEYSDRIKETASQLKSAREEFALLQVELSGRSDQELFAQLEASKQNEIKKTVEVIKLTDEQLKVIHDKKLAREAELTAFKNSEELKRINNSIASSQIDLANETNFESQKAISLDIFNKQIEAQNLQNKINLDNVNKQFNGTTIQDVQNRNAALLIANQTNEDNLTAIKKKGENDRLSLQKAVAKQQFSNLQSSLNTIATLQDSSSQELVAIGKAAAITTATIDGYAAVQKALASAPPPFNFAIAAVVGIAAAANVAKIAGVGGGGGGERPNFSTGGGIAASPSPVTDIAQPSELQPVEPSTQVSVVIQGDVLDSEESGSRIIGLINSAFDKKGVVINQGAVA
jgi:hypothetical protein